MQAPCLPTSAYGSDMCTVQSSLRNQLAPSRARQDESDDDGPQIVEEEEGEGDEALRSLLPTSFGEAWGAVPRCCWLCLGDAAVPRSCASLPTPSLSLQDFPVVDEPF